MTYKKQITTVYSCTTLEPLALISRNKFVNKMDYILFQLKNKV